MKEAPGGNTNSLMSDMQQKEECVSFIEAGRKVQQNPRDAFSNAWEYLHCLNCKLYFNGLPRQRCTNTVSKHPGAASAQKQYQVSFFMLPGYQQHGIWARDLICTCAI